MNRLGKRRQTILFRRTRRSLIALPSKRHFSNIHQRPFRRPFITNKIPSRFANPTIYNMGIRMLNRATRGRNRSTPTTRTNRLGTNLFLRLTRRTIFQTFRQLRLTTRTSPFIIIRIIFLNSTIRRRPLTILLRVTRHHIPRKGFEIRRTFSF